MLFTEKYSTMKLLILQSLTCIPQISTADNPYMNLIKSQSPKSLNNTYINDTLRETNTRNTALRMQWFQAKTNYQPKCFAVLSILQSTLEPSPRSQIKRLTLTTTCLENIARRLQVKTWSNYIPSFFENLVAHRYKETGNHDILG